MVRRGGSGGATTEQDHLQQESPAVPALVEPVQQAAPVQSRTAKIFSVLTSGGSSSKEKSPVDQRSTGGNTPVATSTPTSSIGTTAGGDSTDQSGTVPAPAAPSSAEPGRLSAAKTSFVSIADESSPAAAAGLLVAPAPRNSTSPQPIFPPMDGGDGESDTGAITASEPMPGESEWRKAIPTPAEEGGEAAVVEVVPAAKKKEEEVPAEPASRSSYLPSFLRSRAKPPKEEAVETIVEKDEEPVAAGKTEEDIGAGAGAKDQVDQQHDVEEEGTVTESTGAVSAASVVSPTDAAGDEDALEKAEEPEQEVVSSGDPGVDAKKEASSRSSYLPSFLRSRAKPPEGEVVVEAIVEKDATPVAVGKKEEDMIGAGAGAKDQGDEEHGGHEDAEEEGTVTQSTGAVSAASVVSSPTDVAGEVDALEKAEEPEQEVVSSGRDPGVDAKKEASSSTSSYLPSFLRASKPAKDSAPADTGAAASPAASTDAAGVEQEALENGDGTEDAGGDGDAGGNGTEADGGGVPKAEDS